MSTREAYPRLMDALNEVRAEWRRQKLLEGGLLLLAGVAATLVVLVAADNLLHPGVLGRTFLALLLWGGLTAAMLGLIVRRWLEDHRDDYFAALVEQKHPELHNQLINALQLGRDNQAGFSPGLIDAIVNDAGKATLDMEPQDSIDSRPAKRAGLFALGAVLVIGGYAAAFTPYFTNGLLRVLLPASDEPPYTRTQIVAESVKPGATRVPEDEPIEFSAEMRGVVPDAAWLYHRSGKGDWHKTEMKRDGPNTSLFRKVLPGAAESFEYYIGAGDGESRRFRIDVVKRPQLGRLSLAYTPPPYTAGSVRNVVDASGEVEDIAGTTVVLEVKATKPLQKAWLDLGGRELPLTRKDDDQTWSTSFLLTTPGARLPAGLDGERVTAPASYQVVLQDTDGFKSNDPTRRSIRVLEDRAPTVFLRGRERKSEAQPGEVVKLTIHSQDDYGLGEVRLVRKVKDREGIQLLKRFAHDGDPKLETADAHEWDLGSGFQAGDEIEYWAEAVDRNTITGPSTGRSEHFTINVRNPALAVANQALRIVESDADWIRRLLRLQRLNRTQTAEVKPLNRKPDERPAPGARDRAPFAEQARNEQEIRTETIKLARQIESEWSVPPSKANRDRAPVSMIQDLDRLASGLMSEAIKALENAREAVQAERAIMLRDRAVVVQVRIIKELEALLSRLERNEKAREALKRMKKEDQATHKALTKLLGDMVNDLNRALKDQTTLAGHFERLPKKGGDEVKEERLKALNDLADLKKRWEKWKPGTVNELTKMAEGFIDDFNLRKDINKIFEEVEKAEKRSKAEKLDVALEDLGAGLGTKMKEDLEMWLMDSPDAAKWRLEEPAMKKPFKVPEMPLPKALEDLVGDLLQKADEFDEEADDVTSAWADNLDQAGWGVSDGPISTFSAKGKTGNDQPNNMELTGRSGDGRRGKSSGQMVGDTARALPGRKTPARVGNEKYEPGQLKQEGQEDPNGATGGGKTAGAGRKGLQGGTPPPPSPRDMARLSKKQAGLREKAEKVAEKLKTANITSTRLKESIELMKSVEKDLGDLRYENFNRKRREALLKLRSSFNEMDRSTAARIYNNRNLPPELRRELLKSADEAYPPGYEGLLKNYYKALSTTEKGK